MRLDPLQQDHSLLSSPSLVMHPPTLDTHVCYVLCSSFFLKGGGRGEVEGGVVNGRPHFCPVVPILHVLAYNLKGQLRTETIL